jgi:TrmH family RNA methyltransferase
MSVLRSRDNPRVKRWSRIARDARFRKKERRALLEGPHLVAALLEQGLAPLAVLVTENSLSHAEIASLVVKTAVSPCVLSESLFRVSVDAENPPSIASEIAIPDAERRQSLQSVFLEGVQDPGNVGAIIRSAAAFGAGQIVLDRGCADPWSPKVLRAGMGGHFRIALRQVEDLGIDLKSFPGKLVCAVPRGGVKLGDADLGGQIGWVFGAEGQGVSEPVQKMAGLRITISTAPATESLNVAAAAAICLHTAYERQISRRGG